MIVVREGPNLRLQGAIRFKARLTTMPGRKGWKEDQFLCEPTRANVEWLHSEFPAAEWKCQDLTLILEMQKRERGLAVPISRDIGDHKFKRPPFGHQLDAWLRSRDAAAFAYLMEMGTGKTKVLIDCAAWLFHNSQIDGLVVAAPNGVHSQFVREQLPEHIPEDVAYSALVYRSGGKVAYNREKLEFLKPKEGVLRILSINIEALSSKSGLEYAMAFLRTLPGIGNIRRCLIAIDESTRIKNISSNRTKSALKLRSMCSHARILSGSPVTKGVEDLFSQFLFLSPTILGFKSMYTFRNRYCVVEKGGRPGKEYEVIIGYKNVDELKARMAPYSHRVKKEECLDLPPKMYVRREVPLSDVQRDLYNKLRKELELEFDGSKLTAAMAAVRITKLQQIICGHIRFTQEDKLSLITDVPRFNITRELIEEADGQVIVWARFTADINRLCKELADFGVSRYDGHVTNEQKQQALDDFRSGKNRIFVGQPASAGLGLNLIGPGTVIYFSNSFDAEHRWQSEDRCHRAGTTRTVTYYDLVVPNSIDTHILRVLLNKGDVAAMTIDDFKQMLTEPV